MVGFDLGNNNIKRGYKDVRSCSRRFCERVLILWVHGGEPGPGACQYVLRKVDLGAAYGTAKAGTGISSIAIWRPQVVMKSLIPVVMAGILGIYGMIVAVIISQKGTLSPTQSRRMALTTTASGTVIWLPAWSAASAAL